MFPAGRYSSRGRGCRRRHVAKLAAGTKIYSVTGGIILLIKVSSDSGGPPRTQGCFNPPLLLLGLVGATHYYKEGEREMELEKLTELISESATQLAKAIKISKRDEKWWAFLAEKDWNLIKLSWALRGEILKRERYYVARDKK